MKNLNIILAEDHNIVRDGIRMLLELDQHINIVGEATNGMEVLKMMDNVKADIILTDIHMPEMDGISLIKAAKTKDPHVKVVMLSMLDQEEFIVKSFLEGTCGYLLKNAGVDELIFALRRVSNGERYLCAELSLKYLDRLIAKVGTRISSEQTSADFSSREIEILHLIAEGLTNNEIADKLFISKRTVEGHRQALLEKTGVRNTAALIRYAFLSGLIS